jgi:DNA-binding NarL/FixJ family response regulator
MNEMSVRLAPREKQITELLLQGCDNTEIAKQLHMAQRTVKAHFNRLFLRFGISGGIKRVKLATLLYRRQLCLETTSENGLPTPASSASSLSLPKIGTTEHVVKNYLRVIYDKLGLWNRVELALWYEARMHEGIGQA